MSIAYLDCASGLSGDMTLAALIDAGVDLAEVQAGIDSLGLPSCRLATREVKKCGFRALELTVEHEPEHKHRHLHHITGMIDGSSLTPRQRELATRIFRRLAEAEAKVHGSTIEKVHFHEVGAVDSIADIVGSAIAWDLLGVQRIVCAPIPTGTGFVEIAHGRCSIPAPATAELLRGAPLADFACEGELTTPTGAAIAAALVDEFGPLPAMRVSTIGYVAGQKDFSHPNILSLLVGESVGKAAGEAASAAGPGAASPASGPIADSIILLETNLDDIPGETLGYAIDQLWTAGALDVSTTPLAMKKNRPGVLLAVQARPAEADQLAAIIFRETTALGLRRSTVSRTTLARRTIKIETPYGSIAGIVATLPDGCKRFSPEYESCAAAARQHGVPLEDVQHAAKAAHLKNKDVR
jgi:uncharacterized protein (TIGR00299 family) protein